MLVLADEGRMGAVERALSPSKTLMSSANVLGGEMSVPASVLAACRAATA